MNCGAVDGIVFSEIRSNHKIVKKIAEKLGVQDKIDKTPY